MRVLRRSDCLGSKQTSFAGSLRRRAGVFRRGLIALAALLSVGAVTLAAAAIAGAVSDATGRVPRRLPLDAIRVADLLDE